MDDRTHETCIRMLESQVEAANHRADNYLDLSRILGDRIDKLNTRIKSLEGCVGDQKHRRKAAQQFVVDLQIGNEALLTRIKELEAKLRCAEAWIDEKLKGTT